MRATQLVDVAFKYDNVVMEEAAQILEVETFIPLLLQNPDDGHNRLKRVILIGDHNQLPPVVKNMAFQRYGNMEQSLFARFVRLGVPPVVLNAQGRARPSLAALFAWRYAGLGNLPNVESAPQYLTANTGFAFDFQVCRPAPRPAPHPQRRQQSAGGRTHRGRFWRQSDDDAHARAGCSWSMSPTLTAAARRSHCRTFTRTSARRRYAHARPLAVHGGTRATPADGVPLRTAVLLRAPVRRRCVHVHAPARLSGLQDHDPHDVQRPA